MKKEEPKPPVQEKPVEPPVKEPPSAPPTKPPEEKKPTEDYEPYEVKKGETFYALGKRWGYDYRKLMKINGYTSETARNLKVGEVIDVPKGVMNENEICRFPVYYESLGKRFVYVSAPFQKGIHDGADFGRCSDCKGERPFILACESGTVVQIRNSYKDTAGRFIKIETEHGEEIVTWQYKHLHKILVKKGDKIKVGQKVGIMGDSGGEYSDSGDYADHLHLDRRVRKEGEEDQTSGKGRDEQSTDPVKHMYLAKTDRVAQLHKRSSFKEAA